MRRLSFPGLSLFLAGWQAGPASVEQVVTVTGGEPGLHHVEPQLASNPRDRREVVVAAMQVRSPGLSTWEVKAFWSADGGMNWRPSVLPFKESVRCAADPWLAWGRGRSVYLACLAPVPDRDDFHFEVFLYRSRDAGRSWLPPLQVPVDTVGEWDHPVIARVPNPSDVAGDVLWIVGTRSSRRGQGFGLVEYLDAEGRFGPMRVYRPPEPGNHNFGSAVALDGERLTFTYFTMNQEPPRPLYAVQATRAGFHRTQVRASVTPWGFPMLSGSARRDTAVSALSAVWLEGSQADGLHVVLSGSADGGLTWSPPVRVTEGEPLVFRTRPNIAMQRDGTVAVTWFESASGEPCGDIRVRLARDGGIRFGPERRFLRGERPCPSDQPLRSVVERWRGGGDYSGIEASGPGVFDLVWAARNDGHQVRFARATLLP